VTAEEHIQVALTAALAHDLAGHPARSAACVLLAAVPVFGGLVGWQSVQRLAAEWVSRAHPSVVGSGHAPRSIHPPARQL